MALSLAELLVAPSRASIVRSGLTLLETLGFPVSSWDVTADIRAMLEFDARALEDLGQWTALIARGVAFGLAEGPWLDLIAEWYSDARKAALATRGTVYMTDLSGSIRNYADGELWWRSTATGLTYKNVGAISIPASGTVPVTIAANDVGFAGNAQGATIAFLTPPTQIDLVVGAGTSWITVAGVDEEGDEDLRTRLRAKWGALTTAGVEEGYRYHALSASSEVTRVRVEEDPTAVYPSPAVTVRIATATGAPSGALVTTVNTAVQAKRPLGVKVLTAGAADRLLDFEATIYVAAASLAAVSASHASAIATLQRQTAIGGKVQVADLYELLLAPAGVTNAKVTKLGATTNPVPVTNDVSLLSSEVPVFVNALTYIAV